MTYSYIVLERWSVHRKQKEVSGMSMHVITCGYEQEKLRICGRYIQIATRGVTSNIEA